MVYYCYQCRRVVNAAEDEPLRCSQCEGGFIEEMNIPGAQEYVDRRDMGRSQSGSQPSSQNTSNGRRRNMVHSQDNLSDLDNLPNDTVPPLLPRILREFFGDHHNTGRQNSRRSSSSSSDSTGFQSNTASNSSNPAFQMFQRLFGNRANQPNAGVGQTGQMPNFFNAQTNGGMPHVHSFSFNIPGGSVFGTFVQTFVDDENDPPQQGMTDEQLAQLSKVRISEAQVKDQADCKICLEMFKLDEEVVSLPCRHVFHENCISPWLKLQHKCPTCRKDADVEQPNIDIDELD